VQNENLATNLRGTFHACGREETRTCSAWSLCQVSELLALPQRGRTLLEAAASLKKLFAALQLARMRVRSECSDTPSDSCQLDPYTVNAGPTTAVLEVEHTIHEPWASFSAILQASEDFSLQALIGHKIAAGRVPRAEE
jgi:hypothetical protein